MVERYIQLPGHHSGGRVAHRDSGGVGLGDAVSGERDTAVLGGIAQTQGIRDLCGHHGAPVSVGECGDIGFCPVDGDGHRSLGGGCDGHPGSQGSGEGQREKLAVKFHVCLPSLHASYKNV